MGSDRSARRQERAREFGRRHPRLTIVIGCAFLACVIAICAVQIRHGTYLGRGWLIAVWAGVASAALLSAAALVSRRRRQSSALGPFGVAWLVLALISASAIRYPFPVGPYGSVQAFFNVVHAVLLGYEAVTCLALVILMAYGLVRLQRRPGPRSGTARAPGRHRAGPPATDA